MLNTFDTYVHIKTKSKHGKKITYVWEQPRNKNHSEFHVLVVKTKKLEFVINIHNELIFKTTYSFISNSLQVYCN